MWRDVPCWASPADFFIGPMTVGSAGTYRCYGSLRHCPYEWSAPSDPVDIIITGECGQPVPSALCVTDGLVSSPASVPGENDRRAETLTNSGEGANQRERRYEHGRVREESPCRVLRGRHSQ